MSNLFEIITDDFSDLPEEYISENSLVVMPTNFSVNDKEYSNDKSKGNYLQSKEFYALLREGAVTKTSALSMDTIISTMTPLLESGKDIIYIAFSSGLSGTANNGRLAAEELAPKYPECRIAVVDSLSASLGQGLLVNYAISLRNNETSFSQTVKILEEDKLKFCHYFTVDDLNFLHRGGRISKTTAIVGSMLGIKPVMHVDNAGKLIPIGKVRGRKASLEALVKKMESKIGDNKNDVVYITHGDCEEDANYVASLVKKTFGVKSFIINYVGTTIGSHSGPGTMALFFVGNDRNENTPKAK